MRNIAEEIKKKFNCRGVLASRGIAMHEGSRDDHYVCPFHEDKKPSLDVARKGADVWVCRAGCGGGDVIRLLAMFAGETDAEYLKTFDKDSVLGSEDRPTSLANGKNGAKYRKDDEDPFAATPKKKEEKSKIAATYSYTDANGKELYQAVRMEPKDFRQRQYVNGGWVWNMDGAERVLYHMPEVVKATEVWIVEGEKDADALAGLGLISTCNVGGAGKWLESYSDSLAGRDVILCGDNDEPGQKHMVLVRKNLEHVAKSIRIIKLPKTNKDISDHLEGMSDGEARTSALELRNLAEPLYQGETLPIKTVEEMQQIYIQSRNYNKNRVLKMGRWLPSLILHEFVPGELVFVISETGVGKTSVLTNIALSDQGLSTLFFEQELAEQKMFERMAQTIVKMKRENVRAAYDTGGKVNWMEHPNINNLLFCGETRLSLERLDSIIRRSDLRFGKKPDLVIIDYFQLLRSHQKGDNRYGMFSDLAEGLKILAKERDVIVVCASQVKRDDERKYGEMSLSDAKESGSIENSCGALFGVSRNPEKPSEMCVQVLKSTEYGGGQKVFADYDLDTLRINERAYSSADAVTRSTSYRG